MWTRQVSIPALSVRARRDAALCIGATLGRVNHGTPDLLRVAWYYRQLHLKLSSEVHRVATSTDKRRCPGAHIATP